MRSINMAKYTRYVLLGLILVTIVTKENSAAKILLFTFDHAGHTNYFIVCGKALISMGHEVHMLTPEKYRSKAEGAGINVISYTPSPEALGVSDNAFVADVIQSVMEAESPWKKFVAFTNMPKITQTLVKQCEEVLENKDIEQKLSGENYDMAIVDSFPVGRCLYIIPYRHKLRYVSLTDTIGDPWDLRVSAMPSVEPVPILPSSNSQTFFKRLANLFIVSVLQHLPKLFNVEPDFLIEKYVPDRPPTTLHKLYKDSEIFLFNLDIYLLDYPRISAPHFIYVGGFGGNPAKPLEIGLENYLSSAQNGVVLISFGSMISKLPESFVKKLYSVMVKMPHLKFIFKSGTDLNPPENAKVMKWLPQNDILGHPNVKLFVTHGGTNGQMEALYHGVPMVVCPVFGDQYYNAFRTVTHGYGLQLSLLDSEEMFVETIKQVHENKNYSNKIRKAGNIYKALPKANETVAFWVDHVVKYGSAHLRPPYLDMPMYQFFMLDVLAFISILAMCLCFTFYKCCKCCCNRCCKRSTKEKVH